jgi:outer membrane lipoprotein-sorting protein
MITGNIFAGSADGIVKKANLAAYYTADDGSAQMLMKIYTKRSKKPISKLFYMLKKDLEEGGEQLFFVYFVKPSDIKRTTFLVQKHIGTDDYRRLYIPASDKVLAIAGNRKQDPFMGSDFSYEDVSGRHFSKDDHILLEEGMLKNREVYVTQSIPKVKENKIAKMKSWIDKKTYIPLKVEFYNHDDQVFKVYESGSIKTIDGFPTIMKRTMTSPLEGTKTVLLVNPKKVRYNIGLKKTIFSERSLKNPPVKYLK